MNLDCSNKTEDYVYYSSYLTLVSSCLSIFGSSLIILTFILWKDVRQSVARIILLFLAIADLGTGLGYFISSTGYIVNHHNVSNSEATWYPKFCTGTSFITTFFPVSSFFWTTYLAIYFFVTLVLVKPHWGRKLIIIFNLTAWPIPLAICIIAVSFGVLGQSNHLTSAGWCFVALNGTNDNFHYSYKIYLLLEGVIGKFWEFLFFIVIIGCYGTILFVNRKCGCLPKNRRLSTGSRFVNSISTIDLKLFLIPIIFILLRLPGAYRYILSATEPCNNNYTANASCVLTECFDVGWNYHFLFLQAFCGPLQGFGNAILFVFLSKTIMRRIIRGIQLICRRFFVEKYDYLAHSQHVNSEVYSRTVTIRGTPPPGPTGRGADDFFVSYSPARVKKPSRGVTAGYQSDQDYLMRSSSKESLQSRGIRIANYESTKIASRELTNSS